VKSGAESDLNPSEVSFSSNCIVLHISGPDVTDPWTDLNSIDLPGSFLKLCSLSPIPFTGPFAGAMLTEINLIGDLAISYLQIEDPAISSCFILLVAPTQISDIFL